MSNQTYTIVLVLQSGGSFKFSDVELLSFHLHKQWHGIRKLRILCLFNEIDIPFTLADVKFIPMTNKGWKGWWSKINLFSPDMEQYRPFLFMDLDTAITGNIEGILPPPVNYQDKFIMLGGFNGRSKYLLSGMMWFPTQSDLVFKIWEQWIEDPEKIMRVNRGDQDFIKKAIKEPDERWQNITDKIYNFKPRSAPVVKGKDWQQRVLSILPKQACVVCFHGKPRIPQATNLVWVNNYVKMDKI